MSDSTVATTIPTGRGLWQGPILALVIALGGCGFHLQGASPLPDGIDAMHVSYNDDYRVAEPPVVAALEQRLRRQDRLGGLDASAQLDIVSVKNSQRVLSVSPVNGDAAEYALTSQIVFNYSVNEAQQLQGQTLSITRQYTVDDTQRLAADEQRYRLLTDMQNNLANRVLERIARANDQLGAEATADAAQATQ